MFNPHIVNQTRQAKDSAKKREYRAKNRKSLPRVRTRDLTDGAFRFRVWPPDADNNPHGLLDFRAHAIPQDWVIDGMDSAEVVVQCPRSSNWDPVPVDAEGNFAHRCVPCELDEWVYSPSDPDDPESIAVIELLPAGLQAVLARMDWRDHWQSTIAVPVTMQARVHTHTKEESSSGRVYDKYTYAPGGSGEYMGMLLHLRQPDNSMKIDEYGNPQRVRNGLSEQFFDLLAQAPDCNDLQTGRWFTLQKANGGVGVGGYVISMDPYPSGFDSSHVDYKQIYAFPKWGDKTRNKPSQRLSFEQQTDILVNSAWAEEMRRHNVPLTDAEAEVVFAGGNILEDIPF